MGQTVECLRSIAMVYRYGLCGRLGPFWKWNLAPTNSLICFHFPTRTRPLRWWMELTNAAIFCDLNTKTHFSWEDNNLRLHPPPGSSCAVGGERAKIPEMWRIRNKFKIRLLLPQTSQHLITWGFCCRATKQLLLSLMLSVWISPKFV